MTRTTTDAPSIMIQDTRPAFEQYFKINNY